MKGKQGGAEGEPGAAISGATLRMSEWPPNDQEVLNQVFPHKARHVESAGVVLERHFGLPPGLQAPNMMPISAAFLFPQTLSATSDNEQHQPDAGLDWSWLRHQCKGTIHCSA